MKPGADPMYPDQVLSCMAGHLVPMIQSALMRPHELPHPDQTWQKGPGGAATYKDFAHLSHVCYVYQIIVSECARVRLS
jgi:hypothetical protein